MTLLENNKKLKDNKIRSEKQTIYFGRYKVRKLNK